MMNEDAQGLPGHLLQIWSNAISPQEPWVQLMVRNKPTDFLLGTGATYSVLNMKLTTKSTNAVTVPGASGQLQK